MIACLLIPGFELRAALLDRPRLALRPAALAPVEGTEPLLGPVTAVAAAAGIRPGMRLGEALATCPSLVLVEQDPARAEQAWEGVLRKLEDAGFSVEPAEPGCVYFETRGVERLYGGLEKALERALAAVGSGWEARAGAARRRLGGGGGGGGGGPPGGAPPPRRDRRGDRVPGSDRQRADAPARARGARRHDPRPAGAGRAVRAQAGGDREARRR